MQGRPFWLLCLVIAKECKFKGEWLEATVLEISTWSADSDDEDFLGTGRISFTGFLSPSMRFLVFGIDDIGL